MSTSSGNHNSIPSAPESEIIDAEIVTSTGGQELAVLESDQSFSLVVDAVERQRRTVDLHEASGVKLHLNPEINPQAASMVCLEQINGDADDCYTESYIRLPADEHTGESLVFVGEAGTLIHWLIDLTYPHGSQGDHMETMELEAFIATNPDDIIIAEQLTGRLLVSRLEGTPPHNVYMLRTDVPVTNMDNIPVLIRTERLQSPALNHSLTDHTGPDELLRKVYSDDRYIVAGSNQTRLVSTSTLAMIDAGVQFARLTGLDRVPMSILLAQIYHPDNFDWYDFEEGSYNRSHKIRISGEGVLREITTRWAEDMGIQVDSVLDEVNILDELAVREINLTALVAEYGHVTTVEIAGEESPAPQLLPIMPEHSAITAIELLQSLSPQDRENVENYAHIIVQAIEDNLKAQGLSPSDVLEYLADTGIVSNDVASVHANELESLIAEYMTLAEAKQMMVTAGIDANDIKRTFEAKLVEFIVNNANAIRRTQALAPEVASNFDTLLKIIERTGLKNRSLGDIAQIIGRVVTVQESVIKATFPELIRGIRMAVTDDLGIQLLDPPSAYSDLTGRSLYVATQAEAQRILEYLDSLFTSTGIGANAIPIKLGVNEQVIAVEVGNDTLGETIPKDRWLPRGPYFYTKTRGH